MEPLHTPSPLTPQDREIADTVARERPRLRNFIRRRVIDQDEAEDILQDVFEELVEAWRLPDPIEQVGAWLFRVARNRIIDRFRTMAIARASVLTGHVLGRQIPGHGSAGDIFMQAQFPLHSGRIAGLPGRIAISFTGAVVAMLSVTGVLIWLKKARARRKPAKQAKAASTIGTRERAAN